MKTVVNENFLRGALMVFNFVFSILSIALIALGVVYSEQLSIIKAYIGCDLLNFPTILLILGCLSFVMSIVGCYGARCRSNRSFFITFILILMCLLTLELSVSIIAFLNIDQNINNTMVIMTNQFTTEKASFQELEGLLNCCGIEGPYDHWQEDWYENKTESCCGFENCLEQLTNNYSDIWSKSGCATKVTKETNDTTMEAATVSIVYLILQVLEIGCVFLIQSMV